MIFTTPSVPPCLHSSLSSSPITTSFLFLLSFPFPSFPSHFYPPFYLSSCIPLSLFMSLWPWMAAVSCCLWLSICGPQNIHEAKAPIYINIMMWRIHISTSAHGHEQPQPDTHSSPSRLWSLKVTQWGLERKCSYHTTAQTRPQSQILYVGACLRHTNRCTQTNITQLQTNTNKTVLHTQTH